MVPNRKGRYVGRDIAAFCALHDFRSFGGRIASRNLAKNGNEVETWPLQPDRITSGDNRRREADGFHGGLSPKTISPRGKYFTSKQNAQWRPVNRANGGHTMVPAVLTRKTLRFLETLLTAGWCLATSTKVSRSGLHTTPCPEHRISDNPSKPCYPVEQYLQGDIRNGPDPAFVRCHGRLYLETSRIFYDGTRTVPFNTG